MSGIYIYRGEIEPDMFKDVKAMLVLGDKAHALAIANTKKFCLGEAKKMFEQLKRWVSTGSFGSILISGFSKAMEESCAPHIIEWLSDHSSEPGFPTLVLIDDDDIGKIASIGKVVNQGEIGKILSK